MSNYTKTTNFATKDSLPSGNPAKIVKGTEINTEFDNIAVASATKLDSSTVSTFGATLIDDANASAARTTLGLGTAATTASTDYATAAQGTTADAALPKTGGAMTGAITTNSTFDGRDVATDGTKLDGIESGATADQTAGEIKTAYESNANTNAFTDTDKTKLDGIEASADVTDTTNVTAAGALMDSEVTNLAQVKAFDSTDYATAAQGTLAAEALPKAGGALTGAVTTTSTFDGRDVATDGTKLDGIEAGADVTDATNVVASLSAGTGISLSAGGEIANTAPDQTVALTGAGGTSISGTYPSFTITSTSSALPVATNTTLGGIELFSDTDQTVAANAVTTTAARTYGIQLNSDDQAVVNVPWTDTTYTVGDGGLTEINFTSADNTKLDGIEASADVTDTTNVVASLTAGSNIAIAGDGTISSTASGGGESLQQTLAIGNTTTTNTKINFRDSDIYINSSFDGILDLVADSEVQITSPILEVNGQAEFDGSVVCNNTFKMETGGASSAVTFGNASNIYGRVQWNSADNSLALHAGGQEGARLQGGGGLLVAKTTSSATVNGAHISSDGIASTGSYASWKGLRLRNTNSVDSAVSLTCSAGIAEIDATAADAGTGNSLVIKGGTTGEYARFYRSGFFTGLGIGITAPTQKLHVVGNIVATGNITAYFSDERLKDFKGTIPNALDKISQLNGYYYTPNETAQALGVDNNGVEVGVSAQEVEAVLPEIVTDSVVGKDYKTVMYEKLTPLLIEAVKELTQKVEKLELKLNEMEK